jgi:hypothetical protein
MLKHPTIRESRDLAAELRRRAAAHEWSETKAGLIELANEYENLAEYLKAKHQQDE